MSMKSKTHGKPGKTFVPGKSAALLLLAALAAALATFLSGGTDTAHAFTQGERITGLDITLDNSNASPDGISSDSEHIWVADFSQNKFFAYEMDPEGSTHGDRDSGKDISLVSANGSPRGSWSDGTTIWVADTSVTKKLFAYTLSNGNQDTSKEFNLHGDNADPRGIWSDGTTMWVGDITDDKLYAYTLSSGNRDSGKDFDLHGDNGFSKGIWSDGATMWVADSASDKIYAYALSNGNRDTSKEFDLHSDNGSARGIWSDGATMWVANDSTSHKLFAYDLTRANVYFTIPESSFWQGVARANDRIYLSNSYSDKIRAFDTSDRTEVTTETITNNSANDEVRGIWTDGVHIWAVQGGSTTVYAYKLSDQSYASGENITLDGANDDAYDLWGNDDRLYVVDHDDTQIYAYRRSDGQHLSGEDIDLHSDNGHPRGIWSDGITVWVADAGDEYMYAYELSGGTRDESKEFDIHYNNDAARGLWSDGTYMYVAENGDSADTLYRYDISDLLAPTVTLELSARAISENGGTATVTATLDRESTQETTITVSESSDAVTLTGSATLTIAANATTTTDTVTLTGVDDDVFTGNRFVAVSGTADNTGGVTQPADVRLVVRDDETVPLEDVERDTALDFSGLDTATNNNPYGVWSDGTTMWVTDSLDDKLYAYKTNPGQADHGARETAKEFDLHAENGSPKGIWSDGVTIWVADSSDNKLFAYRMDPGETGHGNRDTAKEFDLDASNLNAAGIWSDGVTIWVADRTVVRVYAYRMAPGESGHGGRESGKEFALDPNNDSPSGVWSDATTIWVGDTGDDKLFAYTLSGRSRAAAKDLDLHGDNGQSTGVFADGTALWVADSTADKLFAYSLMPEVTLELSARAVSENGGTVTVTATLDRASTQETTITVSEDSDAVTLTGSATLTIAANSTTTTDTVTLTGVDDDVFTGSRFVAVSGTAVNTAGVTQPADVRLVVRDDETVPLETYSYDSALDFNGLAAATNNEPRGIWSDGTTMWVADSTDDKLYAYRMNPDQVDHGNRDTAKEFDLHSNNRTPVGVWSDGSTVWVLEYSGQKVYAYGMDPGGTDHGVRDEAKEFDLDSNNADPVGIWSDGVTAWVPDDTGKKFYAYKMNPGGSDHGDRDMTQEFDLDPENARPNGIWSDGVTIWVTDIDDDKLYAYTLSGRSRAAGKDLDLHSDNGRSTGVFADGTALWVADGLGDKVYAYSRLPKVTLELSDRAVSENAGTVTVTATLDLESTHATTITVSESSDAVTLTGTTLTIAAGRTTTTDTVTLTGVDDDVFTANRFAAISGTAVNTDGVGGPADVRLVVRDDETVPVHNMARNSALDFNGLAAATNGSPLGIWSDGTTMWVSDPIDDKLYAYRMNPGQADHGNRDATKDSGLTSGNTQAFGIWSDGATMWTVDGTARKLFAYRMHSSGTGPVDREAGKEFSLHSNNSNPYAIWSDGVTIWVSDWADTYVYAYRMNPGHLDHGQRDSAKEFDLHSDNTLPTGIWSDGETIWVVSSSALKLFAYNLSDGSRIAARDLALHGDNDNPPSIFSDGTTLWVANTTTPPKLFAYSLLPTVTLAVSPTAISENGGTATVTATLDMESSHETTITVSESSADVTQAGTTLTIAAGQTASSGSVVLTGVDNTNEDGSRQVTISGSAVNSYGILGPADIMLTVNDDDRPNNAPEVSNPVGDRTADVGQLFSIDVSRIFTDPDNDPMTFSVTLGGGLDQWLEYDTASHRLSGTPRIDHLGRGQVSITATDVGSLTATDTFQVTVIESHFDAVLLVGNLDQAPCANGRSVCELNPQFGYVIPAGTQRAVEFTTGREGATLNQVVANFQNRRKWDGNGPEPTAFSAPTLELWSHHVEVINAQRGLTQTSPDALLATFVSNRPPDAGNFEYRLTDPYQLQADTTYWLIFGCDDYCPFPVSRTLSDREDRGGMSGWTIANDGRLRSGADRGWGSPSAVIKVRLDRFEYLSPVLVPFHGDTYPHRPGIDPLTDFDYGTTGASSIGLRFDQALDSSSVPSASDFILRYRGPQPPAACGCSDSVNDVSISSVSISGAVVTLRLNRYVAYYGLFSLEYRPGANPLRSASRQVDVERFSEPYVGWRIHTAAISFVNRMWEFDEDDGRQTVTIERTNGASAPFGVATYALLSVQDLALNPLPRSNDFVSLSQELVTFPAFVDTVEVPVTIRDDRVVEVYSRSIYLVLRPSPRNDNLGGLRGTGPAIRINASQPITIVDDDETSVKAANAVQKTVSGQTRYVATYTVYEGRELEIPIVLSPNLTTANFDVRLELVSGESTADGSDYDWKGALTDIDQGIVQFAPLERRNSATLIAKADNDNEGAETLTFLVAADSLPGYVGRFGVQENSYVEVTIKNAAGVPMNLSATAGTDRITLNWDAVTGATRYNVLRRTADQTTFSRIASPTTNTYVDRGARVDVTYHYKVEAVSPGGTSPSSAEASAVILPSLPPAPTGLTATVEEGPQVALSWNAVSDRYLTGYRVSRGGTELVTLDAQTREYTDTGVSVGTTYAYTVAGVNSAGDGPSATVSIEVTAIVDGVRTPGNLRAEAASDGITLHWDGVDNAMRYRVHRKGPGDTAHEDFMSTSVTTFRDSRVTAGETYSYKVQAQDWDFNKGALSDAVQATVPHPLHPPRNFTAELDASNSKTVNLTWDAPTSGGNTLTGYKLFRAKSYNDFTQLGGTFSTTDTGHTDNGTSWDRAHEYRLIAIYSGNRESEPAGVTIRTPRQPPWKVSGLTVATDGATVTLTWDIEGSGRATGYKVFRKSTHGTEAIDQYTKVADVSGGDTTTYQDGTVTSGQDYAYRVVATNNGQDGPPSDNVDVTVEAPP